MSSIRTVSLVPSVTETLRAWGVDPVACTTYCEQPDLACVGGTKTPDIAAIVALQPDVVLVDKVENRREDAAALSDHGLRVVALDVRSLDGLDDELAVLAAAVGLPPPRLMTSNSPFPPIHCRAFIPIWRRPWMTIGPATYGSSLLAAIGIGNVYDDAPVDFPETTLDEAVSRHPDAVLVPTEPYAFKSAHLAELAAVASVIEVDGRELFWWGIRTPAAIARLRSYLSNA